MSPKSLSVGAALAALAVSALGAGHAAADTTAVADPTAQNVTAYGTTAAWSRKAADGYHLVVAQGATVADAPVPVSSRPYDPDLGPTKANGRTVVYARGGDLYRYDVGAAAEQKLTALSSSATEIAPSFFKDTIVFSRSTGKRPGTYLLRPGKKLVRIFRTVALETDVAATRIIGRYGSRRQVDHPHPQHERRQRAHRDAGEGRSARDEPVADALQRHLAPRQGRLRHGRAGRRQLPSRPRRPAPPIAIWPAARRRSRARTSRPCTPAPPASSASPRSSG